MKLKYRIKNAIRFAKKYAKKFGKNKLQRECKHVKVIQKVVARWSGIKFKDSLRRKFWQHFVGVGTTCAGRVEKKTTKTKKPSSKWIVQKSV